jgi:hypothetical protein
MKYRVPNRKAAQGSYRHLLSSESSAGVAPSVLATPISESNSKFSFFVQYREGFSQHFTGEKKGLQNPFDLKQRRP